MGGEERWMEEVKDTDRDYVVDPVETFS